MLISRIRKQSDPEKVFEMVYSPDGAIAAQELTCWKLGLTEATGAGLHIIKSPATANLQYGAGVAPNAIAQYAYGLIQIHGVCTVKSGAATQGTHHLATGGTTAGVGIGTAVDTSDAGSFGPIITTWDGVGTAVAFLRMM